MGNSSSSGGHHGHGGHGHGHHGHQGHHNNNRHQVPSNHGRGFPGHYNPQDFEGWHSLESERRNHDRMKRGYFPPRAYVGPGHIPQPQKVLPIAVHNPNKILKATSNGAILHGGGTISGRKLSEIELEIRKRSTASCPPTSHEERLGIQIMGSNGLSSGRSTPNLLAVPRMGISSSSSSHSRSRERDYGSEPDLRDVGKPSPSFPSESDSPSGTEEGMPPNSFTLIQESPAKKQIRSRKKSKAPPPPPNDPYFQGNGNIPYQYQLQQNPQRQLLLAPVNMGMGMNMNMAMLPSPSPKGEKKRLFKTKAETRQTHSPVIRNNNTNNNGIELNNRDKKKAKAQAPIPQKHGSGGDVIRKVSAPDSFPNSNKNVPISPQKEKEKEKEKKTFYFGMDLTSAGTFKKKDAPIMKEMPQKQQEMMEKTSPMVSDLPKEISRRKMIQKLETSENSRASSRNSNSKFVSESDSDGINRKQDSGSFDAVAKAKKTGHTNTPVITAEKKKDKLVKESSSDFSSSDLDVPLVVTRPTLPQKRPELPRFSPTAAWRAIESPSRASNVSGRSFDIDSSEEGRLQRFTRPSAPARVSHERSGDSGISAGDAGSPSNAIIMEDDPDGRSPSFAVTTKGKIGADRMMKCWTPEQDLDESSSDFDANDDPIPSLPPVPPKPQKVTTSRKFQLFQGKRASAVVSDTDGKYFPSNSSSNQNHSGNRKNKYNRGKANLHNGFYGLDTNWFLSRSEPNSLNYIGLEPPSFRSAHSKKKEVIVGKKNSCSSFEIEAELELGSEELTSSSDSGRKKNDRYEAQQKQIELEEDSSDELKLRDDLFDYLDQYEEGEFEREQEIDGLNTSTNQNHQNLAVPIDKKFNDPERDSYSYQPQSSCQNERKFSHNIMYLPSYDPRKIWNQKLNQNWRRTRSVDNLDGEIVREQQRPSFHKEEGRDRKVSMPVHVTHVTINGDPPIAPNPRPISHPISKHDEEEERRALNRKKFKFQSTLKVKERRKIEEELSLQANRKEEERLREIEEMKRVEEEFQKKRKAREERERLEFTERILKKVSPQNENPKITNGNGNGNRKSPSPSPVFRMSQRQEPEGAPASNNSNSSGHSGDLRRETIISASKKRSGNIQQGTQELSEYRQETRQYCDYRRDTNRQGNNKGRRQQSLSPARYMQQSSSSDIFPVTRRKGGQSQYSSKVSASGRSSASTSTTATIHPEVVCDIPVKPGGYVNASRLGGSNTTMNLFTSEDRPNSVVGPSSPSIISSSDNYRRDWAHHAVRGGGGLQGGRAASVISLHSAPPYPSGYSQHPHQEFRNSATDLTKLGNNKFRANSHISRQYSASPPPSSSPVPSSTATDSFNQMSEKSSSRAMSPVRVMSKTNTTVISIGPQLLSRSSSNTNSQPAPFHAQPYNGNRSRGYRPVSFKPPHSTAAVN